MIVNESEHTIDILGENLDPENYILSGKTPSLEILRDHLHLRPRSNIIPAMARVRNALAMATHEFY
jgi:asparaginyl-tRNA synthetase